MNFTPIPTGDRPLILTAETEIIVPECDFSDYIKESLADRSRERATGEEAILSIRFEIGSPISASEDVSAKNICSETENDVFFETRGLCRNEVAQRGSQNEEYTISFDTDTVVTAREEIGFLRALSTILYLSDKGMIRNGEINDTPVCTMRGYRIYMPGRESIPDFLNMLDLLVYYKYNALILEIGGAMEYKRHPAINEKWVEFCRDVGRYSGRSEEIQYSMHWRKNSIHYENGNGSYLSQDECRMLAAECRKRGIEIIPECPTLSHTDYICLAYPEIAERSDDPYPDTYCPSNPKSYQIVFDILDEVIDVFKPRRINIGHDEFYTVGICKRCAGLDPATVYANDVKVINDYLRSRGVGTMMWGEKLLKARMNYSGYKIGGWYEEANCNGVKFQVPDMWRCADLLPRDVTYIHWYWEFGEHLDDEFHARGLPVVFGNFSAIRCKGYRRRINRGIQGGIVSNWGSLTPEYMQRNIQYFSLIATAYALCNSEYDSPMADELYDTALSEAHELYLRTVKNRLTVVHRAHHFIKYKPFLCGIFINDDEYMLGEYLIEYTDGTYASLPVKLGTNIGPATAEERSASVRELSYSTIPHRVGDELYFKHSYENPSPERTIKSISYKPLPGKENIRVDYHFI